MANGRIDDAEIAALLDGVPEEERARMRFLLVGVKELRREVPQLRSEVAAMRKSCEDRGKICPALNQGTPAAKPAERQLSRETWVMWNVVMASLKSVLLPVAVTFIALAIAGRL